MCTGFIHTVTQLLVVRFLVGFAEGCILPAIVLLLKRWFPLSERARASGFWMLSIPFAAMVMSPLCGFILTHTTWRAMFIIEGLLPIVFAVIWWFAIEDHPRDARWLSAEEREYLEKAAEEEGKRIDQPRNVPIFKAMLTRNVILLILIWFLTQTGFAGYSIWLPTMMKSLTGGSEMLVGWLTSLPWLIAMIMLVLNSRHSDKDGGTALPRHRPGRGLGTLPAGVHPARGARDADGGRHLAHLLRRAHPVLLRHLVDHPHDIPDGGSAGRHAGGHQCHRQSGRFLRAVALRYFKDVTQSSVGGMAFLVTASIVAPLLLLLLRQEPREK